MYAVIETGGKQYRVQSGDVLRVEKLAAEPGSDVTFDRVLMVAGGDDGKVQIGRPTVEGARVTAEVTEHGRAPKVQIVKFRRRKDSASRTGHRQPWTELRIRAVEA